MAEVIHTSGNLLEADADALVNTVNTVGVMGKGIALQFKKAFPKNYAAYRSACDAGEVHPGKMFVFETGQLSGSRLIINFPTKQHWKARSRIEDIDSGLVDLARVLRAHDVRSVAVPPLGCGNGGLPWPVVRERIEQALTPIDGLRVLLYGLDGAPAPSAQTVRTAAPKMTRGRAAVIAILNNYKFDPSARITLLVVQKLAYLLQVAGEPLKLDFSKSNYGPYAEALNHVLQRMDGHFITGYGDRTEEADIRVDSNAADQAVQFLASDGDALARLTRVSQLIDGFESPFGLELLTTVHWVVSNEAASSIPEAAQAVAGWNPRKSNVFPEHHVAVAWDRLVTQGWID